MKVDCSVDLAVSNLEAPFEADETQIRLKGLSLLAEDIDCQLTGTIGHGMNGRLDLVLDLGVPMRRLNLGGFGQLLGAFMRNDGGRVPLRFQIGGTKKEPQVRTSLLSGLMRN